MKCVVHLLSYSCGCSYPWGGGKDVYHDYHCATCHREMWERAAPVQDEFKLVGEPVRAAASLERAAAGFDEMRRAVL